LRRFAGGCVVVLIATAVVLGALGAYVIHMASEPSRSDVHYDISDRELDPVREFITTLVPGAAVEFDREECTAGEDGETGENASSRTPVPGDAADLGARMRELALSRGWIPYEVRPPVTAYIEAGGYGGFRVGVEGTPEGAVVVSSVTGEACDALSGPTLFANGGVVGRLVTDAQRAAFAPVIEAATPVITAIGQELPAPYADSTTPPPGTDDTGGPDRSDSPCATGTPGVGLTPTMYLTHGHVPAPPATAAGMTATIDRVATADGWTSTPGDDPSTAVWTRTLAGQTLTLEVEYRAFTTLASLWVTVSVGTTLCSPYVP